MYLSLQKREGKALPVFITCCQKFVRSLDLGKETLTRIRTISQAHTHTYKQTHKHNIRTLTHIKTHKTHTHTYKHTHTKIERDVVDLILTSCISIIVFLKNSLYFKLKKGEVHEKRSWLDCVQGGDMTKPNFRKKELILFWGSIFSL